MEIFKQYGDVWSEGFEEGQAKERALIAQFLDRESKGLSVGAQSILQVLAIRIRTGAHLPKGES